MRHASEGDAVSVEILVMCPFGLDAGLLGKAACLARGNVRALVPSREQGRAALYGAKIIHALEACEAADEEAFADFLAEKMKEWGSKIILAPATIQMRNIMPMVAFKLGAGLTADCTALSLAGEELLQTRPAFGNSLVADIRSLGSVQMATVREGIFRPQERSVPCPVVIPERFFDGRQRVRRLSFAALSQGSPLSQTKVILAGGMGVGSREGFRKLARLAGRLGAGLAASRTAVDAGFAPYSCQVGMTGVTVCPRLYLAVGISGAVQHLAGMSGAEKIVAVNTDPKAPIFDYADYGILGDWERVIDKLLEEEFL